MQDFVDYFCSIRKHAVYRANDAKANELVYPGLWSQVYRLTAVFDVECHRIVDSM